MQDFVEYHECEHNRAHCKKVGKRQPVANQILVLLQVLLEELAVGIEGTQTVFGVLPHSQVFAEEREDDAADGGQQIRIGQGHPFEDLIIVSPAGAEEGRRVALGCNFFFGSSVAAEQSPFWVFRGPSRTVKSDGNAFGQNMAIRAYENRHLAQRVDLEELLIVLLVFFLGIDEVQFEAMRFRDS